MISDDEHKRIMPRLPESARQSYLPHLQAAMSEFGITTYLREAAFLAQIAHESGELQRLSENLNYSADRLLVVFPRYFTPALARAYARQPERIANRVYANRLGNGPESSGDGWRYRGRGAIQITGRENYQTYGRLLGEDLVNEPDRASSPEAAFRTAAAFWQSNNLNHLADQQDFRAITRRINGGLNGLEERLRYYDRAKAVLSRDDARERKSPIDPRRAVPPKLRRGILPGAEMEGLSSEEVERGAVQVPVESVTAKKAVAKKGAAKKAVAEKGGAKRSVAGQSAAKKKAPERAEKRGRPQKGQGAAQKATGKGGAKKAAKKK